VAKATEDVTGESAMRYGFDSKTSFELWRIRTQVANLSVASGKESEGMNTLVGKVSKWVDMGLLPVNYRYVEGDERPGVMIFRFYRCWRKWVENNNRSPTENEKHWCTELCPGFQAMKAVKIEEEENPTLKYGCGCRDEGTDYGEDWDWEMDEDDDDDDDSV